MQFDAVLRNPAHPEYGVAKLPFPLPRAEYDHGINVLSILEIGDAVIQDCRVDELDSSYPVLNRLVGQSVNVGKNSEKMFLFCQRAATAAEVVWSCKAACSTNSLAEAVTGTMLSALEANE